MKKVAVTGAGGFVGSHLVERLVADGNEVMAIGHISSRDTYGWLDEVSGCTKIRADVRDSDQIRCLLRGFDWVFHLAAMGSVPYSYDAPRQVVETNVMGTLNVALACIDASARMIHTSTSEVYGTAQRIPMDESHPLNARSPYAASKIAADQIVLSLVASRGLNAVVVRPFNIYGPRQSARAIIPRILLGGEIVDPRPKRDFTYVTDTVDAFVRVASSGLSGSVFNVGTGTSIAMGEVVRSYGAPGATDRGFQRPPTAEVWDLVADFGKVFNEVGWAPSVTLSEGIEMTREWFKNSGITLVGGVV